MCKQTKAPLTEGFFYGENMIQNFTIVDNKLYIGGVAAEKIVAKYGSPLYVYDAAIIRDRFRQLRDSITYQPTTFYYACKQNTNREIIKIVRHEGALIEAMSPHEITTALAAGYKADEIMFTCSYLSRKEMESVMQYGVMMNLDSLTQIKRFGEMRPGGNISLRINQGIGGGSHGHLITGGPESKFGIELAQIDEAKRIAKEYGLHIIGIQQHIGSNILDEAIFLKAISVLLETARQFDNLAFIDFGGGFGIPYKPSQKPLAITSLGSKLSGLFAEFAKTYGKHVEMRFEPGRYYVAEAGVLLARVTDIKKNTKRTFVGIDAGMNHLIRPAMYDAYHQILNASAVVGEEAVVDVVGNICESADFFAKQRSLPMCNVDDVLAILDTGASGYVMASFYNGWPLPKELLVDKGEVSVIREKREV